MLKQGQSRHIIRWLKSLRKNYLLDEASPWLTFDSIIFLRQRLRRGAQVFEYGSGGSTLFWLKSGAACVSVEHDPNWYALVRRLLPAAPAVDYRLVPPEPSNDVAGALDPANPDHYVSADPAFRGLVFREYVSQIDVFPDGYFDVVLIDGRARPSCIKHSVRKVRAGGLLILDNADLGYYLVQTAPLLEKFEPKVFFGAGPATPAMWKTNTYIRSSS